jgi:predicted DNA-binding transcriptional regulator AlpA
MSTEIVVLSRTEFEATLDRVAKQAAEAVMSSIGGQKTHDQARLLKSVEIAEMIGVSAEFFATNVSLRRGFPPAINIGAGEKRQQRRWRERDVLEWIDREAA